MRIYKNIPLSNLVYYRIGGSAEVLLEIVNASDLQEAISYVKTNRIENVLPLGLGSNLLISDKGFRGAVFRFIRQKEDLIQLDADLIKVFASVPLDDVIDMSFRKGLTGLEWAGGLPSTVGGAVRGNVGAFGGDISRVFKKAIIYEFEEGEWKKKKYNKIDMQFKYRESALKKKKQCMVETVWFHLKKARPKALEEAKEEYKLHIAYRKAHHPIEYPSCGSVFKNIVKKDEVALILTKWPDIKEMVDRKWHGKVAMGYVIHRLGLGGKIMGGAQISQKHGNYVVNIGNASFNDVSALIKEVKKTFYRTFSFYPELEIEIVK